MMTDPIADFLTRIRNAMMMKRATVETRSSRMTRRVAEILKQNGFIEDFAQADETTSALSLKLKYDSAGQPVIEGLKRVSRPGLRVYSAKDDLPRVRGGLGISIVSTSKGVMTGTDARNSGVGGEVLCNIW